jgi:F-type H+-transporting ATPase subunit gamma
MLSAYVNERLSSFEVVSSRFEGIGAERPTVTRLLPLEAKHAERAPKARYVPRDHLSAAAAREFLYIVLYDLLLDALASEHGARLLATQSAESWLDDRRGALERRLAASRRETSTQEMIEIAAGARVRGPS